MANIKIQISIISLILAIFLSPPLFANGDLREAIQDGDYERIYESVEEADFEYIFGLDPYQNDEYTKYMYSPYPLFRSGVTLVFKSKVIPPGYYLLTPREKDGKTYILFKENGKVSYMIPPYKIKNVDESFYEDKLPSKKLTKFEKIKNKTTNYVDKKWGHKTQRTPIPKAYIEFDDMGNYWDMVLYYGTKKYYLIFKKG